MIRSQRALSTSLAAGSSFVELDALSVLGETPLGALRRAADLHRAGVVVVVAGVGLDEASWTGAARFAQAIVEWLDRERAARVRRGVAVARQQRAHAGRPRKADPQQAAALRDEGSSWRQIARILDCSVRTVRRAVEEAQAVAEQASGATSEGSGAPQLCPLPEARAR